jgi:hypothetical protein
VHKLAIWSPAVLWVLLAPQARADPQGHIAWRTALCGTGHASAVWEETHWCNGVTGDLLLLRRRNRDFGLGPYAEVSTAGFWDVRWGAGATVLLPITESFPLTLSLGLAEHALRTPAVSASVFFGARSYNFDGAYNWALGLYASGYRDLNDPHASLVSAGLEVDGFFVIAPFLLGVSALR